MDRADMIGADEVRELLDALETLKIEPGDIEITWKEASLAIKLCRHYLASQPAAGKCEHGITEGDWCEQCNREYKEAMNDKDNA